MLSKEQMKTVAGAGTCAYTDGNGEIRRDISKATATSLMAMSAADSGAHWCCDSCDKATWL